MMTKLFLRALVLLMGALTAYAQEPSDTRIIASAKDWSITAQQFEQFLELLPDQQHQYFAAHRRDFLDQLVRIWVMAADARARGIDKTPKFKATVDFYSNNMLAGELHKQQVTGSTTASDQAVKAFYEANKSDFTKMRLSHILILNADGPAARQQNIPKALPAPAARKRIEEALGKLRGGANFEELAREYSQDQESAVKGGDLGYVSKGQLPAALETAALNLKEGAFSDIVESPFGFHILRLTELKVAPLTEVSSQIRQKLDAGQFDAQVEAKVKEAGVKIDESFFEK